ncbi:MAG: helix-turn-helix transcriptional regulator [Clostridiales bacterium]|nr:helix-turn-helix transcriptional regulator [Candidatus Cacconaster stercorequi]
MVSRQAITKWESDKGVPDIENLKLLSSLLGVSIDYLLSNDDVNEKSIIREKIDLSLYNERTKKKKKDRIVRERYPDAQINGLMMKQKNTKEEKIIDNLLGFLTPTPFGVPEVINGVKNLDKEFYLVDAKEKQFLVMVTDEFIESRENVKKLRNVKMETFDVDLFHFRNVGPIRE